MSEENRKIRAQKIQEAFKNPSNVEVIPPDPAYTEAKKNRIERVGAYCRVSTKQESQTESLEVQKAYFDELIRAHPNWELVDIYADEGISATSMKHRKNFLRMIEDCKAGKLTMVVTKTVSRFARNTIDCVETCRLLKGLSDPVAVYFETVNLNTLSETSELLLTLLSSVAQEESAGKSASMIWAIRSRFEKGIPRITKLYGMDVVKDELHRVHLVPNENIWVVQMMYDMIYNGHSIFEVKAWLLAKNILSPTGISEWSYTTILYVLTNEKYCGDVVMQKTERVDMFTHKSVKNNGQLPKYILRDYHEAVVPREKWTRVQIILGAMLPMGEEIKEGQFAGFRPLMNEGV